MSLFISSLNSGSNGNCYYVGNHNEAVLIDAGISCRETERRLLRLGLSVKKIKAVFISHEHADHINGIKTISKKYQLPVYITLQTLISSKLKLDENLVKDFNPHESIQIGDLCIAALPKLHDAAHPHSFTVSSQNATVGVFTDIGKACKHVVSAFKQCNAAFLETNYDEQMLENGRYPYHLKKRISGDHGHLSNTQALELFKKHKPKYMSHLLLAHLSRDNNCPELVKNLFLKHAAGTNIIVASRDVESEVYRIRASANAKQKINALTLNPEQLSLF